MRFADLLGEPDDDGNAPGSSTSEGPGVPASDAGTAPTGASGSFGGATAPDDPPAMDDDLARWFSEEVAPVDAEPNDPMADAAPPPGRALASATGALDEPVAGTASGEPEVGAPAPSGVARDDLLPARPSGHGRRRR